MCAVTTADRGFTWSDEETSVLLRLWGANDAQSELTGNKRNFIVYERISERMNNMGFVRTASQCREKIKRMKREYTLTKQFNSRTTGPKKLMRFYEQFERILQEKQSKNITLKTKTFASSSLDTKESDSQSGKKIKKRWDKRSDKRTRSGAAAVLEESCSVPYLTPEKSIDSQEKDGDPWAPAVVLIEGDEQPASTSQENHSILSQGSVNGDPSPRKKRKIASRMGLFQSMMDSLTLKFMQYQEEADARFLSQFEALEQERVEMDVNIQKMWLEFEERRRREDAGHEMSIMANFKNILGQVTLNHISKDE